MECGPVGQAGRERFRACDSLYARSVGRANSKPRKAKHEHLTKVGSAPDLQTEGQRERSAVMDVMGLGNLSPTTKSFLFVLGALILIAGIFAFILYSI